MRDGFQTLIAKEGKRVLIGHQRQHPNLMNLKVSAPTSECRVHVGKIHRKAIYMISYGRPLTTCIS